MGLEDLGRRGPLTRFNGASAGAVNAQFPGCQAAYHTIYYQKINNTRFIRRLWHRKVVDIDDLFDSIIAGDGLFASVKCSNRARQFFITIADASKGKRFLTAMLKQARRSADAAEGEYGNALLL